MFMCYQGEKVILMRMMTSTRSYRNTTRRRLDGERKRKWLLKLRCSVVNSVEVGMVSQLWGIKVIKQRLLNHPLGRRRSHVARTLWLVISEVIWIMKIIMNITWWYLLLLWTNCQNYDQVWTRKICQITFHKLDLSLLMIYQRWLLVQLHISNHGQRRYDLGW